MVNVHLHIVRIFLSSGAGVSCVGHQHPGQDDAALCERGGELGRVRRAVRGEGGLRALELARHNQGGLGPRLPPALRCRAHQLGRRHCVRTQELRRSDVGSFDDTGFYLAFTWAFLTLFGRFF